MFEKIWHVCPDHNKVKITNVDIRIRNIFAGYSLFQLLHDVILGEV